MNILFLTPRLPYPPIKGDKLRAFHQIRHLSKKHNIFLLSFIESKEERRHVPILKDLCQEVVTVCKTPRHSYISAFGALFSPYPLQVGYYASRIMSRQVSYMLRRTCIELIHIQTIRMAPYARAFSEIPTFLDLIDFISLNLQRRLRAKRSATWPLLNLEYQRMVRYERQMIGTADLAAAVSHADILRAGQERNSKVAWIPNGIDSEHFSPKSSGYERGMLLFTGNMGYFPNVEAATYFCNRIFPLVRNHLPDSRFYIVGANPARKVRQLAQQPSVTVTGTVPDVRPYYDLAHVFVCPMQTGAGMQNKILEAMAMGVPVVTTSLSNGGIGAQHGKQILVADQPDAFAKQVVKLSTDNALRERIAEAGQAFVRQNFSWVVHAQQLDKLYHSLILVRPGVLDSATIPPNEALSLGIGNK